MTDHGEHVIDDLAAYALGSLEPAARARVETHVTACASCTTRLAEYRGVVGVLPLALSPVAPPSDLWDALRASARRAGEGSAAPKRPATRRRWLPAAAWIAAAAACTLLVWNVHLQSELARYAEGPQVEKLARRPARLVILRGTALPHASARIFAAVDGVSGHMAVSGLPLLRQGRVYQLWFMPMGDGSALKAATFAVDPEGRAWVVISVPVGLDRTRLVVITEEPAGSMVPTGPPLLEAREWR